MVLHQDLIAEVEKSPEGAQVAAHLRKGHTVAIISSATRYQLEPAGCEEL